MASARAASGAGGSAAQGRSPGDREPLHTGSDTSGRHPGPSTGGLGGRGLRSAGQEPRGPGTAAHRQRHVWAPPRPQHGRPRGPAAPQRRAGAPGTGNRCTPAATRLGATPAPARAASGAGGSAAQGRSPGDREPLHTGNDTSGRHPGPSTGGLRGRRLRSAGQEPWGPGTAPSQKAREPGLRPQQALPAADPSSGPSGLARDTAGREPPPGTPAAEAQLPAPAGGPLGGIRPTPGRTTHPAPSGERTARPARRRSRTPADKARTATAGPPARRGRKSPRPRPGNFRRRSRRAGAGPPLDGAHFRPSRGAGAEAVWARRWPWRSEVAEAFSFVGPHPVSGEPQLRPRVAPAERRLGPRGRRVKCRPLLLPAVRRSREAAEGGPCTGRPAWGVTSARKASLRHAAHK
ncbi:basic salivary proline-rich protein 1-like [Lepus europaeus]|uniref:basic salivary proline-rich protein 1-like n=1 Tax=Lepus europaeus TaxID=9983 RepID=UPI002B484471|nr:basic salivary proline-rich protein 1-like [Lepus europaeus]